MIKEYQDEQQQGGPTDEFGEKLKYYPTTEDYGIKPFVPINFPSAIRPATAADIAIEQESFQALAETIQTARLRIQELVIEESNKKTEIAEEGIKERKAILRRELNGIQNRIRNEKKFLMMQQKMLKY
jgi:hypothetical protein